MTYSYVWTLDYDSQGPVQCIESFIFRGMFIVSPTKLPHSDMSCHFQLDSALYLSNNRACVDKFSLCMKRYGLNHLQGVFPCFKDSLGALCPAMRVIHWLETLTETADNTNSLGYVIWYKNALKRVDMVEGDKFIYQDGDNLEYIFPYFAQVLWTRQFMEYLVKVPTVRARIKELSLVGSLSDSVGSSRPDLIIEGLRRSDRLTSLGIAVLSFLCASHLYFTFDTLPSGELTAMRATLLDTNARGLYARRLKLRDVYTLVTGAPPNSPRVLIGCLDGLFGALYTGDGVMVCRKLFLNLVFPNDKATRRNLISEPVHPCVPIDLLPKGVLSKLQSSLGNLTFRNQDVLALSLVHNSLFTSLGVSNDRLEFLGDAVMEVLVLHSIIEQFPCLTRAEISDYKSFIVRNSMLIDLASSWDIQESIRSAVPRDQLRDKHIADAVEAIVGAVYIDQGFSTVLSVLSDFIHGAVRLIVDRPELANPKFVLQKLTRRTFLGSQKAKRDLQYRVVGPVRSGQFHVEVYSGTKVIGQGISDSVAGAEYQAALDGITRYIK